MLHSVLLIMNIIGVACLNVALKKPTYASSQLLPADGVVDGKKNKRCFSTDLDDYTPWFMVDLQSVYEVFKVTVINRKDFYYIRLHDIKIELFKVKPSPRSKTGKLCYDHPGPVGYERTFTCRKGAKGRFLRIIKLPKFEYAEILDLCEVEVEASKVSAATIKTTRLPVTTMISLPVTTTSVVTTTTSIPVPVTLGNRIVPRGSRCLRVERRPSGQTIPSSLVIALQDCPRTCRNTRSDDGAGNGMSCTVVSGGSAEALGTGPIDVNVFDICTC